MRYKEFNRNSVLERCIPLFWKNGFRACAISDIVNATRVNRFSLYEEFGNKEGILLATLELYRDRYSTHNLDLVKKEGITEEVLIEFYMSYLQDTKHQDGCFIIHVGTELADSEEDVRVFLKTYLDDIESLFKKLLDKDAATKTDSPFYARQLIGLFCTTMSFCLIHSEDQRKKHIQNGINVIINRKKSYAQST